MPQYVATYSVRSLGIFFRLEGLKQLLRRTGRILLRLLTSLLMCSDFLKQPGEGYFVFPLITSFNDST
jgi:hypothetical protein